ncbi:ABC transporter ATP-binding protein [Coriobacteriales bacterium OH1046]|nr:ABC transporter ATP-binding protein [Coriobacteriales bacterium OH1046]
MAERLLDVEDLTVKFHSEDGAFTAVDSLSFTVNKGESVCIVGESGCGKSVTSLAIMGLLNIPPAEVSGRIGFEGKDLLKLTKDQMRDIRGDRIAMIFQEPMTSLNPVFTCGYQISEALMLHQGMSRDEAKERSIELLRMVGIPLPEKRFGDYPHQLSGGLRQRVMISMALACNPGLLIADEPTTALDVTIQAQIMKLLRDLKAQLGMALILITHDMGVVAQMAERVIVMYAGDAVESSDVRTIFKSPLHPYTLGLLESIPRLDSSSEDELATIEGTVPGMYDMPKGCKFAPRCMFCTERCLAEDPEPFEVEEGHMVRCFNLDAVRSWLGEGADRG